MAYTRQDIQQWAPHPGLFKEAERLAAKGKWMELGQAGALVWGMTKSKRIKFFKVLLDTDGPAFYCSCPSRQRPCQHVLALWLLLLEKEEDWSDTEPEWLDELKGKLRKRGSIQIDPEQTLRNAEARSQSRQKRIEEMQQGMRELEIWIEELLQQGLAQTDAKRAEIWEVMAGRLVDAKLGGVAGLLRSFPQKQQKEDWPALLFADLTWLYSITRAYRQFDQLPSALQADLLQLGGLNLRKDQLNEKKAIDDDWLVLGLREGEEDRLRYRRSWMYGVGSRRFALILDFVFGQADFEQQWKVGQSFRGGLIFYPGAYPQRAVLREANRSALAQLEVEGYSKLAALSLHFAEALQHNPWLQQLPVVLEAVVP
ncbi:MAG: hypothetical protein KDC44_21985, partial [Phaeodactylibacter sp.]|nr:hypothetical protein [Phaeodactylibacter sp.]